jgi:hypothetical protein
MYIHATPKDLARWEEIGFNDILRYIHPQTLELWVEADTGEKMMQCPYLCEACALDDRRLIYFCAIHEIKPHKCKDYVCLRKELGWESQVATDG